MKQSIVNHGKMMEELKEMVDPADRQERITEFVGAVVHVSQNLKSANYF